MSSDITLTIHSIAKVPVQVANVNREMVEIKAGDASTEDQSLEKATLRVSEANALAMNAAEGASIMLPAELAAVRAAAVNPDTITEDVATIVMVAGAGFDTSGMEIVVYDDAGEIVDEVAATSSANHAIASITIADAVAGFIGVKNAADEYSNRLAFEVEAA